MEQRALFAPGIVRKYRLLEFHTRSYIRQGCRQEGGSA